MSSPPKDVHKHRPARAITARLRILRFAFKLLDMLSPRLGANLAYRLWFRSPRFPEPARERRWRQTSHVFYLPHEHGPIAVYRWGQGPVVLLVHGWSGRGTQLGAFVEPLVARGFSVVAFDAPGHGRSPGKQTNALAVASALQAVANSAGAIRAIVAHSFGTIVTTLAIHQGMVAEKIVCISAPTSPLFLVENFCRQFALSNKVEQLFIQRFEAQFGADIWQRIASDMHMAGSHVPGLIIHDTDDVDVPWQWSQRLANAWPRSHLWLTNGLGHRRILRHPAVLETVADFIAFDRLPENG